MHGFKSKTFVKLHPHFLVYISQPDNPNITHTGFMFPVSFLWKHTFWASTQLSLFDLLVVLLTVWTQSLAEALKNFLLLIFSCVFMLVCVSAVIITTEICHCSKLMFIFSIVYGWSGGSILLIVYICGAYIVWIIPTTM